MKYYIFIILLLSCIKFLLQFVKDAEKKDSPWITLIILIAHIIAAIGYFNLMFTEIN